MGGSAHVDREGIKEESEERVATNPDVHLDSSDVLHVCRSEEEEEEVRNNGETLDSREVECSDVRNVQEQPESFIWRCGTVGGEMKVDGDETSDSPDEPLATTNVFLVNE